MALDDRLIELLARYEELREQGRAITPHELCRDFPELVGEVERRLVDLARVDAALASRAAALPGEQTQAPANTVPGTSAPSDGPRYQPLRFHARGGLGEVLLARDCELDRHVALKRIQSRHLGSAALKRRFLREAEITGSLEHPGVVPIYGVVKDEHGEPSYAMRFIEGESLLEAIRRLHANDNRLDAGLAFRELLQRFVTVCNTMAYAHSRGVVHRDLKPANIMLGKYGETLVVDWGLAKRLTGSEPETPAPPACDQDTPADRDDSSLTAVGQAVGTPAFMSPEQAAGEVGRVGTASDIYSLGATLFALLTGVPPPRAVVAGGIDAPGLESSPRQVKKDVPRPLDAICRKALAHEPSQRYATALELARDIERWLGDEPVTSWREPWHLKARRWARKHRALVASFAVAAVVLVASTVGGYQLWHAGERKRQEQAESRLVEVRTSALANETLALAELRGGRFASGESILRQALEQLPREEEVDDLRARLAERHDRFLRLVDFYRLSDRTQHLAMNLEHNAAIRACRGGLARLGLWDHEDWWLHLPLAEDLLPAQLDKLQVDAYRQVLFLGGLRALAGLMQLGDPSMRPVYEAAREDLKRAERFRPSHSARLADLFCRLGLGERAGLAKLPPPQPTDATDYYFLGVMHLWLKLLPDDPISRIALASYRDLSGLDFKTPSVTAEHYLQTAAALDARHPWTFFWLGQIHFYAERLEASEAAFNSLVALRPEDPLGYHARSSAALAQFIKRPDPRVKSHLLQRALTDLDRAYALDPLDLETVSMRFECFNHLQRAPEALATARYLLDLLPPLRTRKGWAVFNYQRRVKTQLLTNMNWTQRAEELAEGRAILADVHAFLGSDPEALAHVEAALKLDPQEPRALAVRGELHLRKGKLAEAAADFRQAARLRPNSYAAAIGLARALEKAQDWPSAQDAFQAARTCSVAEWQRHEAVMGLARVAARQGHAEESRRLEQQAENGVLLASERPSTAPAAAPGYPPKPGEEPIYGLVHVYRGIAEHKDGNLAKAEAEWQKGVRVGPDYAYAQHVRGEYFAARQDWPRALADFDQAVRHDPGLSDYFNNRGNAHFQLKHDQEALADLAEAIRLNPKASGAYNRRALVHRVRGEYEQAVAALDQAIALSPKNAIFLGNRAHNLLYLGHSDRAVADCTRALELSPRYADLYELRAGCRSGQRRWTEAIDDARRSVELEAKRPTSWYKLGLLQVAAGDLAGYRATCLQMVDRFGFETDAAITQWVAWTAALAKEGTPQLGLAERPVKAGSLKADDHHVYAATLFRLGRFEDAARVASQAVKLQGKAFPIHEWLFLAMAHHRLGDVDRARTWLAKAEFGLEQEAAWKPGQGADQRPDWYHRLQRELLLREARAQLEIVER